MFAGVAAALLALSAPCGATVRALEATTGSIHAAADVWTLATVFAKSTAEEAPVLLHQRNLRHDVPQRRALGSLPDFTATESAKDRVLALLTMNIASYPSEIDALAKSSGAFKYSATYTDTSCE